MLAKRGCLETIVARRTYKITDKGRRSLAAYYDDLVTRRPRGLW